ncbi:MAG: hypothetical protein WCX70_01330 [Candidatus Paceibacterota bacterium]
MNAEVTGSPTSVSANIAGINGDGDSYWNYYADGTGDSDVRNKVMTYDGDSGKYISPNIYPDDIYPELYYAPSSITWNNIPSSIDLRRNNYHLFHLNNPFVIRATSTVFIEANATPNSIINSARLDVYLVEKGKSISFFNSDWRNDDGVELVGSFDKNSTYHHTHVEGMSSHHLVALRANEDGTIGEKNLDITDDFWVVLYSNSPKTDRGWDLKYHEPSLCTNTERWYVGSQSGWLTSIQTGCPDFHLHFARRGEYSDGVITTVTASYEEDITATETQSFYFEPLPNLAPNHSSFVVPVSGGVYDGGSAETKIINLAWATSTDPNGDNLTYDIYLLDADGNQIGEAVVSSSTQTTADFDITAVDDDNYGMKGVVCDEALLCTDFVLASNFTIDKIDPLYSLAEISLSSNNSESSSLAEVGDIITA